MLIERGSNPLIYRPLSPLRVVHAIDATGGPSVEYAARCVPRKRMTDTSLSPQSYWESFSIIHLAMRKVDYARILPRVLEPHG